MTLAKSLLLGTAAALAAVAGAQAADLPARKAAPVEYVRVCSTYGEGFFYVPGTDSCLRISGRVRVDVGYIEPLTRAQDAGGVRVRGRVNFDHRTATAYGLLRTYVRYEIDRNSGFFFTDNGRITTGPNLAQAFIQFGGLTAGRVTSFFDNADLPTSHMGTLRFSDAPDVNLLAYTYAVGNGFSATIALEDALERRVLGEGIGSFTGAPLGFTYGGQRVPDLVGNVRYAGAWGSVQLSGALHQIRDIGAVRANPITGTALPSIADTDYGFAVSAQAGFNLPFLGAGDTAWLALSYTDGATGYILGGTGSSLGAGLTNLPVTDAFVDPFTGDFKTTQAYSIAGGLTHNWTPTVNSSLFGSYARFEMPNSAGSVVAVTPVTLANGTAGTQLGFVDFNEYRIGANTFWTPVSGLQIGVEALYTKIDPRGRVAVTTGTVAGTTGGTVRAVGSDDIWEGRLRLQRDF
ncbi:MAG TPA: porin [Microvirga sp.]|jgi:hypothetical protein